MPKKQNKHVKVPKMTKKRITERRHHLRFLWAVFAGVSFAVTFFNVALSISGGWDDVNALAILVSISFSLIALLISSRSVIKYEAKRIEALIPLGILIVSTLFYFTIAILNITIVVATSI